MPEMELTINGKLRCVAAGTSVAAAILESGISLFRTSISGEPRSALCGMGICYECRVTINGTPQARSCQIACQPGMVVVTG